MSKILAHPTKELILSESGHSEREAFFFLQHNRYPLCRHNEICLTSIIFFFFIIRLTCYDSASREFWLPFFVVVVGLGNWSISNLLSYITL